MVDRKGSALGLLSFGLRCVCPRCGNGRLYAGFLQVAEHCDHCGLALARHDSGDGPAVFLVFILGAVVTPLALWVGLTWAWPLWLHAVVWSVVVLGLAVGMLRPAKAYFLALQYRHRPEDFDDDSDSGKTDHFGRISDD